MIYILAPLTTPPGFGIGIGKDFNAKQVPGTLTPTPNQYEIPFVPSFNCIIIVQFRCILNCADIVVE